jgi:hypothetical protein
MTVADGHTILMDVTFSFSNSSSTSSPLHASTAEILADLPSNPSLLRGGNASTFEHSGIGMLLLVSTFPDDASFLACRR